MINRLRIFIVVIFLSVLIQACGGGGGGGDSTDPTPPPPADTIQTFSVQLNSIDIRRSDNQTSLNVDISQVQSGTLTLR